MKKIRIKDREPWGTCSVLMEWEHGFLVVIDNRLVPGVTDTAEPIYVTRENAVVFGG